MNKNNYGLSNTYKSVLWLYSIAGLLVKSVIDVMLMLFERYSSPGAVTLRILLSLVTIIPLYIYFFKDINKKDHVIHETSFDFYSNDLTKILLFALILIILSIFLPNSIRRGGEPHTTLAVILIDVFSYFALLNCILITRFLYKWLWINRFKRTKLYLKILLILLLLICISELPSQFKHLSADEVLDNKFIFTLIVIIQVIGICVIWLAAKKNTWIAFLSRKDKWVLIGLSVFGLSVACFITSIDLTDKGDGKFNNALNILFPLSSTMSWVYSLSAIYFLRILFTTFATLPTTGIVERRTSEISSLTYLNKLVAQTIEFDRLIDTVTQMALYTGGGYAAWTDIIGPNGTTIVKSCENINKDKNQCESIKEGLLNKVYADKTITDYLNELSKPLIIESLQEFKEISFIQISLLFQARSMIIMPLFAGNERIGNLFIVHPDEYGFENDYLTILSAFSDNINIALENARLLADSIEKEKYKQELMIARNIEQKLIPAVIPDIKNYSVSAFTLAADEVGGDFYDIITLKNGKKCIILGDVSGKGISAAFYMVLLKGVVLAIAKESTGASDLLKRINATLFGSMEKQMFITISSVVIDDENGNLTLARAGHMPFILKKADTINIITPKGIGIGLAKSFIFDNAIEEISISLENNDALLVYSDGITELKKNNIEVGTDFLKHFFENRVYNISSQELINNIKQEAMELSLENSYHDDMTLTCLIYNGNNN